MKLLIGFVVGVVVASTASLFAQSWGIGEDSRYAREGRDWQLLWQQQQLDEARRYESLPDPCRR